MEAPPAFSNLRPHDTISVLARLRTCEVMPRMKAGGREAFNPHGSLGTVSAMMTPEEVLHQTKSNSNPDRCRLALR